MDRFFPEMIDVIDAYVAETPHVSCPRCETDNVQTDAGFRGETSEKVAVNLCNGCKYVFVTRPPTPAGG